MISPANWMLEITPIGYCFPPLPVLYWFEILNRGGFIMIYAFAERVGQIKSSVIREILKVTEQPGVISFAGGLPAPKCFLLRK